MSKPKTEGSKSKKKNGVPVSKVFIPDTRKTRDEDDYDPSSPDIGICYNHIRGKCFACKRIHLDLPASRFHGCCMRFNVDKCKVDGCKYPHHVDCRSEWVSIFKKYQVNKGTLLKGNQGWINGPTLANATPAEASV